MLCSWSSNCISFSVSFSLFFTSISSFDEQEQLSVPPVLSFPSSLGGASVVLGIRGSERSDSAVIEEKKNNQRKN